MELIEYVVDKTSIRSLLILSGKLLERGRDSRGTVLIH